MQLRSFLRFLAPFALASLMLACGDDPAEGGGDDDEPKTTKKDSGIVRRKDAGTTKTSDNASEDDEDEEETPVKDAGKKDAGAAKDAGPVKCTVDSDCVPDDEMDGIGCCDKPTKMCFVSTADMCPPPKTSTPSQPAYN